MLSHGGLLTSLRGRSAPVTLADEIDGLPKPADTEKDEGDQVELLRQRAASFSSTGQVLHVEASAPTVKGHSRIEKAHDQGDCRKFHIPCQHCGESQVLKWEQVTWNGRQFKQDGTPDVDADAAFEAHEPDSAQYVCEHCGALWDDADRKASVRNGEWIATRPFTGHASFHLSELYSPFRFLSDIVKSYLSKVKADSYNTFVNVALALTYEGAAEVVDPTGLKSRAEVYAAQVPMGGLYLTAGIDMQMDRLEVEIVAWGEDERSWSVDYRVIPGDPMMGDVWEDLDDLLAEEFTHESGMRMRIASACLDTGGTSGCTQAAYEYLRGKTGRRLFGVKGFAPSWGAPIVAKSLKKQSGKNARKVDLYLVAVDEAKQIVMRRLAKDKPGPGYCHIPADRDDLDTWLQQLTAEKLVTRYVKGQPVREWHKGEKARNEALDCRVYALAALKIMKPSFRSLAARLQAYIAANPIAQLPQQVKQLAKPEAVAAIPPPEIPQVAQPEPAAQTQRVHKSAAARRAGGRNWVTGWK
jgi:phage terminase large subunit GpA-like protein